MEPSNMEYDYKIKLYTSGEKLPPYLRLSEKAITSPLIAKTFFLRDFQLF
jgi:hypothetical protein